MIVVLGGHVSLKDKASIVRFIEQHGGRLLVSELGDATHIGLVDTTAQALADQIRVMPGVSEVPRRRPTRRCPGIIRTPTRWSTWPRSRWEARRSWSRRPVLC